MPHVVADQAPLKKITGELRRIADLIDKLASRPATEGRDHVSELGQVHEALSGITSALTKLGQRYSR